MKKRTALAKFPIIGFLLFLALGAIGQSSEDNNSIDISMMKESQLIIEKCQLYFDSSGTTRPSTVISKDWKPSAYFNTKKYIPNEWITKPLFLKFTLENSGDTSETVYFIAGYYIRSIHIFKLLPNRQIVQLKDESRKDGYQRIKILPKEKQEFIAEIIYSKRNFNYFNPLLIKDDYLKNHQYLKHFSNNDQPIFGNLLSGILLMMIFFTFANYLLSKKKEFLYNCCYSACMFGLIFLNTFLEKKSGVFSSLFHEYFDFMLLGTGTVFFIAFTRMFLETKEYYPLLNKIFVNEEKFIIILLAIYTFIVFFTNNFQLQKILENGMKIIVLLLGIVYIVIAISHKNKLMNYIAIGNAILIFFSIISLLFIMIPYRSSSILTNSLIYYEIGIVGELIFFLTGLTYKNRIELIEKIKEQEALKLAAEKQSYETRLALLNAQQLERNRISADMHDDLGAGVTAIRLYSELAKKRIGKEVIPEIEKISSSANELLNNMNAIIWTMSSSNDSLDNMIAYIRTYSLEYFENTGIDCFTYIDEDIPNVVVGSEIRRNIYLVIKEALNNILKHSRATEVHITLKRENNGLSLYIQDNGKGIDFDNLRKFGNGLKNMKKRMEETQILFSIKNNNGTLITLHTRVDF